MYIQFAQSQAKVYNFNDMPMYTNSLPKWVKVIC